ncbi:protein GAMETE EXPRESSED 1-like [Macadamia integrifolia]|uniref:protein GAMETE EXPRESSED 1-like n=1 Tax=Macadamia integrifolia TaxID=60698 RepID=UPI001C501E8F|nr:protein GAMETE EXPRESSED 1-like [Macadamia integrifolia]XP_042518391.1 protein GAMETE EXPRESSED 1-like [Macadamia integrifolia]
MGHFCYLSLFLLLSFTQQSQSWGLFSSSTTSKTYHQNENPLGSTMTSNGFVAEFSMGAVDNRKAIELVENAKRKLDNSNSCWQKAYRNLFTTCSDVLADREKQSRLAWHLSDCFQEDTGRPPFPTCKTNAPIVNCLKKLDEQAHKVYLEFFLQTNLICHQLQSDAFKQQTERLVNDLKRSAELVEDKLENMEERSDKLLQNSNQIQDSLTSIDFRTQQMAQTSKDVEVQIDAVLEHSKAIFTQSKGILDSQSELREGQTEMKEKIEVGMALLHESYQTLGQDIEHLRHEAVAIEKEINEVGESMSSKMKSLQNTADDIGSIAGTSLDKQKELLDGQSTALEGLNSLTNFQSQALEESRAALQKLAEFSRKQQEELQQQQQQLQQAHDQLVENSKSILAAQEAFESKQARIFVALDKLFTLQNAMLMESRSIKTFFFYALTIFVVHMLTSTKHTYCVRARLYLGLSATFLIELAIMRFFDYDLNQQTGIASKVHWARWSFSIISFIQILYSIFTYRDYEVLNHHMLLSLSEKIIAMERNKPLSLGMEIDTDTESDVNLCSWIVEELPEDVDNCMDPDYMLPEEVGENSLSTTTIARRYNLRPRLRR